MTKIPLSRPFVSAEVEEAALRALRSGQYILADECRALEAELAASIGVRHVVLGTSWTMIVYLLHLTLGVKPGDEIVVPSHTAFPTIEPLLHCGATPVFADIDATYCMDVTRLESLLTPRTVGLIPVHLYGHPVDLDPVLALAARHRLWVLEDCAQAQGATYRGRPVGTFGSFAAFSFYPSKNLTVLGDGGCLTTDDDALADRLRMLRNHGRKGKYLHEFAGFNVRFNEVQAAVARVMLRHLDRFNDHRRAVAARYNERLAGLAITPPEGAWARAVYHMYVVRVRRRDELQKFLAERGIETGIHYPVPNHRQPAITARQAATPHLPATDQAVQEILSLPIHGEMPLHDVETVCDAIEEFHARDPA